MQPFTDIHIQPSYGNHTALITWEMNPSFAGNVWVYKSPDGAGDWDLASTTPVDSATGQFEDTNLVVRVRTMTPHYRLVLEEEDGTLLDGPVIGMFEELPRHQYQAVSKAMKMEYMNMSRGSGIQVLHYKPVMIGPSSSIIDPITGAVSGDASCPADTTYGAIKTPGFRRPLLTWIILRRVDEYGAEDRDDGKGLVDEVTASARFLAYPRPNPGDIIVHPPSDSRYQVLEKIRPILFRGIMPVAYEGKLLMLQRNDPRMRIPLPDAMPPTITRP